MSIFDTIKNKIFGAAAAATPTAPAAPAAAAAAAPADAAPAADAAAPAPVLDESQTGTVDVEEMLESIASNYPGKPNWRYSIVDLLTILGIDSGLSARRELAAELGYTGDTSDTATMNTWLHKQVMRKLAENGGKVPAELMS